MKKIIHAFAALFVLCTLSCSNDDSSTNSSGVNELTEVFKEGTWQITLYAQNLDEQTSQFMGYNFTFADNNVLTASNGTNTYTGFWSITNNINNTVKVNISFPSPENFAELSEDWQIEDHGSVGVYLGHESGGDGSFDSLIFTKNN